MPASSENEHPLLDIEGPLATITFNRPEKFNAMTPALIEELIEFFYKVEQQPEVRCVLMRGNGKHFMAGGDLEVTSKFASMTPDQRRREAEQPMLRYTAMARMMQRLQKPVVASVQGGVAGGALGLVAACDLVIATESSFYWAAHILHGGSNDGLLTYFLPRQIGLRRSLEMALLGDRISAAKAYEIGLINFVVPDEALAQETAKLVERLCKGPTLGYGLIKDLMYASHGNSLEEQGHLESAKYGIAINTADVADGLASFFERRAPNFNGR
jgi:2-(1,2-epoxy-1,2-dihydrophenyl)acetyl-CoA isomerase